MEDIPEGVHIGGLGVDPPREATVEVLKAFGDCGRLYFELADEGTARWFQGLFPQARRAKSAAEVVAAARRDKRVGLAVWGHPQYSSRFAREVTRLCRVKKIPCHPYGVISPIASVLARSVVFFGGNHKGKDFGLSGFQAFDLDTLLADPGLVETGLALVVYSESAPRDRWDRLARQLSRLYPADHRVTAYAAGSSAQEETPLSRFPPASGATAMVYVPLRNP